MKSPNGFIFFWIKLTPNIPCPCLLVSSAACRPNERHPRLHGSGGPAPNALSMDVYTWFSKTGGPTKPTKVLYFDVDGLFFPFLWGSPIFEKHQTLQSCVCCRSCFSWQKFKLQVVSTDFVTCAYSSIFVPGLDSANHRSLAWHKSGEWM